MSIEYTERIARADVYGQRRHYKISDCPDDGTIRINDAQYFTKADVPEVCEAMMRLAGHEWPVKAVYSAPNEVVLKAAAERIIGRMQRTKPSESQHFWNVMDVAIRIVREECGVAE